MTDEITDTAAEIATRIAQEMAGGKVPPLTEEQVEARETYLAELRMTEALEREAEQWHQQRVLEERQRLAAEVEVIAQRERALEQQRAQHERIRQQQAQQDAARAAQAASDTRAALARQEWTARQRAALEEQARFFRSLGPLGNSPPQPDPVLDKLNEISAKLDEPEPTLYERLTDPRRFKFDWQP